MVRPCRYVSPFAQRCLVKAGRFGTEHQDIAGLVADIGERRRGMRREGVHPSRRQRFPGGRQIGVDGNRHQVVVIQACAPQFRLGEVESEWLDQMQFAAEFTAAKGMCVLVGVIRFFLVLPTFKATTKPEKCYLFSGTCSGTENSKSSALFIRLRLHRGRNDNAKPMYRFAPYYRQTYGRSPHTTLRN